MTTEPKKIYRITDNIVDPDRAPYCLLDPEDTVIEVGARIHQLSNSAFDRGADEVRHEYDWTLVSERSR